MENRERRIIWNLSTDRNKQHETRLMQSRPTTARSRMPLISHGGTAESELPHGFMDGMPFTDDVDVYPGLRRNRCGDTSGHRSVHTSRGRASRRHDGTLQRAYGHPQKPLPRRWSICAGRHMAQHSEQWKLPAEARLHLRSPSSSTRNRPSHKGMR